MLLEKTLILKGVAGAAAVGGVVGGGYFLKKSLEKPLTKEEKLEEINKKLGDLGLGECNLVITDLTTPTVFSKDCELDQAKLQKIKFSNKAENSNVTVTGLTEGGNIKLNIANKEGNDGAIKYTFKEVKTKLTIKGDPTKPNITLKPNEEREFEDKGGKLGKVSKASQEDVTKTKAANAKLKNLKIPDWCRFEEEDKDQNSIECDLSNKEELKKIDFSNKEKGADSKIESSTTGLKLTINRLSDEEGELKFSPKRDLEFIFSGYSEEIKIQDSRTSGALSDFVLKPNTNPIFTMTDESAGKGEENRLAKGFNYSYLGGKVGMSCTQSSTISCTPSDTNTTIKLLNSTGDGIDEIAVEKSQDTTQIFSAEENTPNYEQGIKFKVTKAFPTTNSKLTVNDCYEAKYLTGKGWALSKKTNC